MRNILAMAQRELSAFFYSPIAYVVLFAFTFMVGLLFCFLTDNFSPGAEASLRDTFNWLPPLLCVAVPILTMRLISEEYRTGTIESLMTAPISDMEVVLGKFLGTLIFYAVMLAATLFYVILLFAFGDHPDSGMLFSGYLGLLLIGSFFVAIGLFFSSLTRNQIIAALLGAFFLLLLTILAWIIVQFADVKGVVRMVLQMVSVMDRFQSFNRGLVDLNNLVFFVGGTVFFLFLAVKSVESRRWR